MSIQASVEQGFRALEAWSWEEARTIFEQIVSEQESAEALEGLGARARIHGIAALFRARCRGAT